MIDDDDDDDGHTTFALGARTCGCIMFSGRTQHYTVIYWLDHHT